MGRLFGTDGVRGVANADLTAELALGLSVAAAHVLAEAGTFQGRRPVHTFRRGVWPQIEQTSSRRISTPRWGMP